MDGRVWQSGWLRVRGWAGIWLIAIWLGLGGIAGAESGSEWEGAEGVAPVPVAIPVSDPAGESAPPAKATPSAPHVQMPPAPPPQRVTPARKKTTYRRTKSGGFPWGKYKEKSPEIFKDMPPAPPPVQGAKDSSSSSSKSPSQASGRRGRYDSHHASPEGPREVVIGASQKMKFKVKEKTFTLEVRSTGIEDEYLTPVASSSLAQIASLLGATSWKWQAGARRLEAQTAKAKLQLQEGQSQLPSALGGRQLDVPLQRLEGGYWAPISILEDLLGVRVTVNSAKKEGWIEPLITAVRLEGSGRQLRLHIQATAPVTYSTFRLSQPERYVIDLAGGVLDTTSLRLNHPELGDVRLGQFTLGPAVSRIVIPTALKVEITAPATKRSSQFNFALQLPQSAQAINYEQEKLQDFQVRSGRQSGQDTAQVKLNFSGPVQYEWQRLTQGQDRFLIDFKRVVYPATKGSQTVSGPLLKGVRVSQYASKPQPVTRVVLELEGARDVRVSKGEGTDTLLLEILPQKVDLQMAALRGSGSLVGIPLLGGGGRTICLDAGHGGSDPGCISPSLGTMEKDVSLDITLKLAQILRRNGWKVYLTRETDRDVTWAGSSNTKELNARVEVANRNGVDVFVSIHCNAASSAAQGTSTHTFKRGDRALAQALHPELIAACGRPDRGIQQDRFYLLVHSKMPAVLIETAFLSNPTEAKLLSDPQYRQKLAEGIARGLGAYANKYLQK